MPVATFLFFSGGATAKGFAIAWSRFFRVSFSPYLCSMNVLPNQPSLETIIAYFKGLQDSICQSIETADGGAAFQEDVWERPGGGGGRSRVLQGGGVIEKGGVNFSHVHGLMPDTAAARLGLSAGGQFHATGVSLVLHPHSPRVPITHMNVRYFEIEGGIHWFGGGIDLTPIYIVPEDARFFHEQMRAACDALHPDYYPRYKAICDQYFFIKHRNETRGVGGVFFDHLKAATAAGKQHHFELVQSLGERFAPTYTTLMHRRRNEPFTEREKHFQLLRRSRYAEFNLVYDAGTKFGLETDGRIESILMSMPPLASWEYNYQPEPGSPEAFTMAHLKAVDWPNWGA